MCMKMELNFIEVTIMWFGLFDKRSPEQKEKDKLMRRRENILSELSHIHTQQQFALDFFNGPIAGPRIRAELAEEEEALAKELEDIETRLGL